MGKREDETFSGLVYVLVIDFSLFLLPNVASVNKHWGMIEKGCFKIT